jgi:hypothetical protein
MTPVPTLYFPLSDPQTDDEQLDRDHDERTGHHETDNRQHASPIPERRRRCFKVINPLRRRSLPLNLNALMYSNIHQHISNIHAKAGNGTESG